MHEVVARFVSISVLGELINLMTYIRANLIEFSSSSQQLALALAPQSKSQAFWWGFFVGLTSRLRSGGAALATGDEGGCNKGREEWCSRKEQLDGEGCDEGERGRARHWQEHNKRRQERRRET